MIKLLQAQALAAGAMSAPRGRERSSGAWRTRSHNLLLSFTQRAYFDSGPYGAVDGATGRKRP